MQGFVHLTLFALLFVISARAATSPIPSVITNNNIAAPGNITTPAGTSNMTALWAAAGANTTTAAPAPTTTTAAAGANTTTAAPAPTTTTAAAGANTTTAAPAPTTTTAAAGANTTTAAPAPTTTTAAAGANTTTAAPAPPTTTAAAGASNTTAAPASTIAPRDLCRDDSCTGGAFCVNLNNTHFCQCVDGYYYTSSSCKKGKVFPGVIQVKTADTSDLRNKMSVNYEKLHMEVNKFFKDVFTNSDYEQTIIQQVSFSTSVPARSQLRAGDAVVNVTVVNLFAENTKENEKTISNKIHTAISNSSSIAGYTNQDRCDFYRCKNESDCSNGFQCECKAGYERPDPYTAICLPLTRKCPYACNSKPNTQCLAKNDGSPDCVCLAGYKKDDREKCQACAFGYSGVNCEDNFQLILTVLGTVAGVLILGMVIALIFTRSKKTKDIEEQNLIQNDFQNLKLQQTTGFSYPSEGHIFPKITASFPRDGGMQNPYVTPRGIPRPDY